MNCTKAWIFIVVVMWALPVFAGEQSAGEEWANLNQEVEELYQQAKYDRAVELAGKALGIARENVGDAHPDVAASLNGLAKLHLAMGDYAEAEQNFTRALAIREEALGPDHPDVAITLGHLSMLYRDTGREAEAEKLEARAAKIEAMER